MKVLYGTHTNFGRHLKAREGENPLPRHWQKFYVVGETERSYIVATSPESEVTAKVDKKTMQTANRNPFAIHAVVFLHTLEEVAVLEHKRKIFAEAQYRLSLKDVKELADKIGYELPVYEE
jgi:hypothetical protein